MIATYFFRSILEKTAKSQKLIYRADIEENDNKAFDDESLITTARSADIWPLKQRFLSEGILVDTGFICTSSGKTGFNSRANVLRSGEDIKAKIKKKTCTILDNAIR